MSQNNRCTINHNQSLTDSCNAVCSLFILDTNTGYRGMLRTAEVEHVWAFQGLRFHFELD